MSTQNPIEIIGEPTGGTYTVTYSGVQSKPLPFDATREEHDREMANVKELKKLRDIAEA